MSNSDNNQAQFYEKLINGNEPIDADDPRYEEIFRDLQGGLIKSYGRNYYVYIFMSFHEAKVEEVKQWIRHNIANDVTSTYTQLQDTKVYKQNIQNLEKRGFKSLLEETYPGEFLEKKYPGEFCKNFFLSYQGYKTLFPLKNKGTLEEEPLFSGGMKAWWDNNYKTNNDKPENLENPKYWDIGGDDKIHALILLTHNSLDNLKKEVNSILEEFEKQEFGNIVACEVGYKLRNENEQFVGPFGFVDNFSQPLFLKSDYDKYCQQQATDKWDPKASLSLALVKDPFGEPYSFGSYCVWQKLETNYERFKDLEKKLAETLGCDREKASALVVGRFKDGTPIALYPEEHNKEPIKSNFFYDYNNFDYYNDQNGERCPLQAHIRKVNPRKDQTTDTEDPETRKTFRIFRAGVTYFDDLKAQQTFESKKMQLCLDKLEYLNEVKKQSLTYNIESISGLLFVCFQSSIVNQFQTLQNDWADDRKFPREESIGKPQYLDPVIGHPITKANQDTPNPQECPKKANEKENFSFYGCVQNKGGEFFFAPSISFLKKMEIS